MAHLRGGASPIAVIAWDDDGGIRGKTEMRKMSPMNIQNGVKIAEQIGRYLNLGDGRGLFLNNADCDGLSYINFLRILAGILRSIDQGEAYGAA